MGLLRVGWGEEGGDAFRPWEREVTPHCFDCPWGQPLCSIAVAMCSFVVLANQEVLAGIELFKNMPGLQKLPLFLPAEVPVQSQDAYHCGIGREAGLGRKISLAMVFGCQHLQTNHGLMGTTLRTD